jgi:putative transport protein
MEWIETLIFDVHSIPHAVLTIGLVAALGIAFGSIKFWGIGLGIGGCLFSGLLFGHFGIQINHEVLEFLKEFGLILFVYTIGLQVGPSFLSSLKKTGLTLNIMAAVIVSLGALIAVGIHLIAGVEMPAAVGLFSGATTNTPSLGAAQNALASIVGADSELNQLPGLGYAVAYPFGIMGIIMTMLIIRFLFGISPKEEADKFRYENSQGNRQMLNKDIEVTNSNLQGVKIKDIPSLGELGVVISRVLKQNGELKVASADTELRVGDTIHAVGFEEPLKKLIMIIGKEVERNVRNISDKVQSRRIIVTKKNVLGKTLKQLCTQELDGVIVTRIGRLDIFMPPNPNLRLQFGDTLRVVGETQALDEFEKQFGNSVKELDIPHVIPIFIGIVLGVIVGSIPIEVPLLPAPIKLGLAGGPLLVAIILSSIGNIGPMTWYLPTSSNFVLREVGIVLFLCCVGLKSGGKFIDTLVHGDGFIWMGYGAIITAVPLILVGVFARLVLKQNYMVLCGVLAGSLTDPPALAFANQIVEDSQAPSISYATVYPLVMTLRILYAQLLVLFFCT